MIEEHAFVDRVFHFFPVAPRQRGFNVSDRSSRRCE